MYMTYILTPQLHLFPINENNQLPYKFCWFCTQQKLQHTPESNCYKVYIIPIRNKKLLIILIFLLLSIFHTDAIDSK